MSSAGSPLLACLSPGDKYTALCLNLSLDGTVQSGRVGDIDVIAGTPIPLDDDWKSWLGTVASEELASADLLMVAKIPSKTPGVLDRESQQLLHIANTTFSGLVLAGRWAPAHSPVMVTGGREGDVVSVRQHSTLDPPVPCVAVPYPDVSMAQISQGIQLAAGIRAISASKLNGGHWRLFHTLHIYIKARANPDLVERVHQFSRCIDGLILPSAGNTKSQFKSRTELFIGPQHHDLMGGIYDIRSADEHLNDAAILERFNRDVRMDILQKEIVVETIARSVLAKIIGVPALWPHFANTDGLAAFWALQPAERAAIWGAPYNPLAVLAGLHLSEISDYELGRSNAG